MMLIVKANKARIIRRYAELLSLALILFILVRIQVPDEESRVFKYCIQELAVWIEETIDEA
jgi:hypothetical protein